MTRDHHDSIDSTFPSARAPRLWTTFTLAWLLVLVITVSLLVREPIPRLRLVATLADLALVASLYLAVTLHGAPRMAADSDAERDGVRLLLGPATLAALVVPLILLVPDGGMGWHIMYAVVASGLTLPPRQAAAAIVVFVLLAIVAAWITTGIAELRLLILLAIGGSAMAVRHLTITVAHLREAREELAQRAVDAERLRIARDLHDLLGHSLSLITLKSELAGRLLRGAPDDAAREIADIERASRLAMREVRDTVSGYRRPTLRGEIETARNLLTASAVGTSVRDECGELPPSADTLMAWAVREGVTNVIRHSAGRACAITTWHSAAGAHVRVSDDGARFPLRDDAEPSAGSGLAGLRERCALLGATLDIMAGNDGFAIEVCVPVGSERAR